MTKRIGWVVLAGLVLLGGIGLAWRWRTSGSLTQAQAQTDSRLKLGIGTFSQVTGSKYQRAPAVVTEYRDRFFESYESKKGGQLRNFVFLNTEDLTNQWLLPHSRFLIAALEELPLQQKRNEYGQPRPQDAKEIVPAQLHYYEIVKADTNQNKYFDDGDRKTVAISEISGSGYSELVNDVDEVFLRTMTGADELLFVYHAGGKYFAAKLSLSKRQVVATKEIAPIPEHQPVS